MQTIDPIGYLVKLSHRERDFYVGHGHNPATCSIGHYGNEFLLASDDGAIAYTLLDNGKLRREHRGHPSQLIDFVDTACREAQTRHNRQVDYNTSRLATAISANLVDDPDLAGILAVPKP